MRQDYDKWRAQQRQMVASVRRTGRVAEAEMYERALSSMPRPVEVPDEIVMELEPLRRRFARGEFND